MFHNKKEFVAVYLSFAVISIFVIYLIMSIIQLVIELLATYQVGEQW